MEESPPSPPGEGPYRTPPRRIRLRRRHWPWVIAGGVALLALAVGLLWPEPERTRPPLSTVPPGLFDRVTGWPMPEPELPVATPLAPLLVADSPEALAVLSPGEGAVRLRRGQGLTVRFNRPMVEGYTVGRPAETSPLSFDPALPGEARWVTRSQLSFQPDARAWSNGVREVQMTFAGGTASLGGEDLVDDRQRVLVLDGAPRLLGHRSGGRINAGAALPLVFDAPVATSTLARELLAYEIGGGQRSLPVTLVASRNQPEDAFRIDVRLRRGLEPGARVGLALAPRYSPWESGSPLVASYELAPRPHVEGIACNEGAAYVGQCSHAEAPGRVIEIGPVLRLLSSARLDEVRPSHVRVRPALRDMRLRLAPHGPPQKRLIEISGEWAPDQVYEVRVAGLRTEDGEPVRALPPLAVRSAGHSPQIRVASGHLTYEPEAEAVIPFAAIHPAPSDVLYRPVADGDELRALVSPTTFVRDGGASEPLAPMAPDARPNRWGPGRYAWRDGDHRDAAMAVVAFREDASRAPGAYRTAFVQATDLGVTVRANERGLLVWVTSIATGAPVRGADVTVADAEAHQRATARTDGDGVARIPLEASPLVVSHAIRVVRGDDRAALLLDPRRAIGPSSMGLTPGAAQPDDAPVATVFTDRGAYRPGETMHAKVVLRTVDGARVRAVRQGRFRVRLFGPSGTAAVAEHAVEPSRWGTAAVDFQVPRAAPLGGWRVEIARDGREERLGSTGVRVAEFRQPTFRVDVGAVPGPVHAGDTIGVDASATYLFGAPVTRGRLRWSLSRSGGASYPERWSRFRFTPVGASAGSGTVAAGEDDLDASGALHVDAQVQLAASARTTLSLEAEVTDSAGHTHASRRAFVAYPAAVEVGLKDGDDWVELGEALELEAVAIDHDGAPVSGRAIEARFAREGWHSWWEWSDRASGSYQMRRDQQRQVVHRCRLTSEDDPVRCAFTPSRPGTYVMEVEARDDAGRVSTASRRLYVAGPDEHPDRDPPGAPIAVTPVRTGWTVGETAELAFESPWEDAQALITVEREGVLHVERRQVGAGGQVVRVPVRPEMVPNAFVGVTLVRPRAGPPGGDVDLNAPDLRFGVAELRVEPAVGRLAVTLEAPPSARPGSTATVTVQVRDERGRPVRGEVALWAVDEGTLRLTGFVVPDPSDGLFRPHAPAFAWEDVRRQLVSRVQVPPMPEASGDGSESDAQRRMLDDRERFDPTPLWAPQLVTDEDGRATATIELPTRPTEYRVMAVVVDAGARAGRASTQLVAEQPIVLRPAFPRFLTAGDAFEAAVFVHNATERALDVRVTPTVGGAATDARLVAIEAGGEVRVATRVTAPDEGPLELRFDAEAGGESVAIRDEVPVVPRGRFVRSQIFVAGIGQRELSVGLPEGTPNAGTAGVTVASHPFVGFEGAIDALEASAWTGTEPVAGTLLALAAYASLDIADPQHGIAPAELEARGRRLGARLIDLQNADGGFARWSALGYAMPGETAIAVHALVLARRHGWIDDEDALTAGREALGELARGAAFGDAYGERGLDRNAYALRVLADAEAPEAGRANALYEQRERLSPYGLAQLAMALGAEDPRADTLVLEASRRVLADREDERDDPTVVRWNDHSARVYGAVLEAASRFEVGRDRAGELAGHLLRLRGGRVGYPWGTTLETARALGALAEYARLWRWDEGQRASVRLDGDALPAIGATRGGAFFTLPIRRVRGQHTLTVEGGDEGPVFFSVDGHWAVPLGEADTEARGRRVAVHRVFETPDGRPIEDGAEVPLGAMVRVRLFVYTEGASPDVVALRDPLPAGFDAVDAAHDTSPRDSLTSLLGVGPDDGGAVDARAHHAMRSLSSIAHRSFGTESTRFYFDRLPRGLAEYTYAVRATTIGTFTVPPAQLEALYDPDFVARSALSTLRVVEAAR